jgi:hypothetical protein
LCKPAEQRTPEEQEELSGLDLVWDEQEKRYIVLNEDPTYPALKAYERALKEVKEDDERRAAERRARLAARGGGETND